MRPRLTKQATRVKKPEPRDLTRDKVIAAALSLIDEAGARAVTMRGVAEALAVTPMALYNHFSSKDDLLLAIAANVLDCAVFDGAERLA